MLKLVFISIRSQASTSASFTITCNIAADSRVPFAFVISGVKAVTVGTDAVDRARIEVFQWFLSW